MAGRTWWTPRDKPCLQEYNIKQMEGLYGKDLSGHVQKALDTFREESSKSVQTDALNDLNPEAYKRFVGSPYKNTEVRAKEQLKQEKNLNKLSTRHIVKRTPTVDQIRSREGRFVNDAIVTERRRTRFKDIIPQYDASADKHCRAYFKRNDVQQLVTVTKSRDTTPLRGSTTPRYTPRPTPGYTPRPTPGVTPTH